MFSVVKRAARIMSFIFPGKYVVTSYTPVSDDGDYSYSYHNKGMPYPYCRT